MAEPKKYVIEIGINLNAAKVPVSDPTSEVYPLQNALVDATSLDDPVPAWYTRLAYGDLVTFQLVDFTAGGPSFNPNQAEICILFSDPDDGSRSNDPALDCVSTKPPFTEEPVAWLIPAVPPTLRKSVYSTPVDGKLQELPTWTIFGVLGGVNLDTFTLAFPPDPTVSERYELVGWVGYTDDQGVKRNYVFDPEMIVSDTGG